MTDDANDRVLVVIHDADDFTYRYLLAPAGMCGVAAEALVAIAINKEKKSDPEEYTFENIADQLERVGFAWPVSVKCSETW